MDKEALKKQICELIDNYIDEASVEDVKEKKELLDASAYFDEQRTACEEAFLSILEEEKYNESFIGYNVTLYNSVLKRYILFTIADVNHDGNFEHKYANHDYYDLISKEAFHLTNFGENNNYRDSNIREWLNDVFVNGFNYDIIKRLCLFEYKDYDTCKIYVDKVIIPSAEELGFSPDAHGYSVWYKLFSSKDKIRKEHITIPRSVSYWTRTSDPTDFDGVISINDRGDTTSINYHNSAYVVPMIRL